MDAKIEFFDEAWYLADAKERFYINASPNVYVFDRCHPTRPIGFDTYSEAYEYILNKEQKVGSRL